MTIATDLAQGVGNDDIGKHLLSVIFPALTSGTDSIPATALGNTVFILNTCLAFLASGLLSYVFLKMLVNAGKHGNLTKGTDSLWGSIRVFIGISALAPAIKGYSVASFLIVNISLLGMNIANKMWSEYAQTVSTPSVLSPTLPDTNKLAMAIAEAEACNAYVSMSEGSSALLAHQQVPDLGPKGWTNAGILANSTTYAGDIYNLVSNAVAGGNYNTNKSSQRAVENLEYGECGRIQGTFAVGAGDSSAFDTKRMSDINAFAQKLRPAMLQAAQYAYGGVNSADELETAAGQLASTIEQAKQELDKALVKDAESYVDAINANNGTSKTEFTDSVNKYGFMTVVPYFYNMESMQTLVSSFASTIPSYTSSVHDKTMSVFRQNLSDEHKSMLNPLENAITEAEKAIQSNEGFESDALASIRQASTAGLNEDDSKDNIASLYNKATFQLFGFIEQHITGVKPEIGTELAQISYIGNEILNTSSAILAGGVATQFFPAGKAVTAVAGQVLNHPLGIMFLLPFAALFASGVMLAYVLPMLPSLALFFLCVNYIFKVIHMTLVAPFWMITHINFEERGGFAGNTEGTGYKVLATMLFEPACIILGAIASIFVLDIYIRAFEMLIMPMFRSSGMGAGFGVIAVFVSLGIIAYVHFQGVKLCIKTPGKLVEFMEKLAGWSGFNDNNAAHEEAGAVMGVVASGAGRFGNPGHSLRGAGGAGNKGNNTVTPGGNGGPGTVAPGATQQGNVTPGQPAQTGQNGAKNGRFAHLRMSNPAPQRRGGAGNTGAGQGNGHINSPSQQSGQQEEAPAPLWPSHLRPERTNDNNDNEGEGA